MLYIKIQTSGCMIEGSISFRELNEFIAKLVNVKNREFTLGKNKFRRDDIISIHAYIREDKRENNQIVFGQSIT